MEDTYKWKFGTGLGLFTLTVGLSIFLIWWGARAMYAHEMYIMQELGFVWILISIPIATIGLILNIIYLVKNYRTHLQKALLGIGIILLNIPTVYWILDKYSDINQRVYLQIYNDSLHDLTRLTLTSDYFEKEIGALKANSSKVFYFYPEYIDKNSAGSPPPSKPVLLTIQSKDHNLTKQIDIPNYEKGHCGNIYIDKNYSLLHR